MRNFQEIRDNYQFTDMDLETLRSLAPVVEPYADRLVGDFYTLLMQMPDTAKFLTDPERLARLKGTHREWLLALFTGPHDERYFQRLMRIGHAHVRIGLSAHFVYVSMNFLRLQLQRLLATELSPQACEPANQALQKILDLNLDVIARTYHEAEVRRKFFSYRLDNALISFARRFTFGLNLLLVVGLIGLSLGVVGMFLSDASLVFTGNPAKGLVASLGSLLVLWMVIELLEAEIDRLQGGGFQLNLFVGAALVAFIRKILVATVSHEEMQVEILYLAGIFILGVIFWLVSRAEMQKRKA